MTAAPVAAAIAVLVHEERVLLVRRANPPDQGLWGYPGGRIEAGETVFAAAERELREETGIRGRATRLIEAIDLFDRAPDGTLRRHFILLAIACDWVSGSPAAGDDALDVRWFAPDGLRDGDPLFSVHVARIAQQARPGLCPGPAQGRALRIQ